MICVWINYAEFGVNETLSSKLNGRVKGYSQFAQNPNHYAYGECSLFTKTANQPCVCVYLRNISIK